MIKFIHNGKTPGWERLEVYELASCDLKSANNEIAYVGLVNGEDGFFLIEGG